MKRKIMKVKFRRTHHNEPISTARQFTGTANFTSLKACTILNFHNDLSFSLIHSPVFVWLTYTSNTSEVFTECFDHKNRGYNNYIYKIYTFLFSIIHSFSDIHKRTYMIIQKITERKRVLSFVSKFPSL